MADLKGVEVFAVGKWNGMTFTQADLDGIAGTAKALASVLKVPLKLGHNDEQRVTDGQPALGWATNVRTEGGKLLADFVDVPEIVAQAVGKKLYNTVSIELDLDVSYKGNTYPFVLTGVALLGADLPAVNTLSDLAQYVGGDRLQASRRAVFTAIQPTGGVTMTPEEIAALKAENARLQAESAKFSADNAQLRADAAAAAAAAAKVKFTADLTAVVSDMDALVRAGKLTPAQRDVFSRQVQEGDEAGLKGLRSMVDVLATGVDLAKFSRPEQSAGHTAPQGTPPAGDTRPADMRVMDAVHKLRASSDGAGLSFSAARDRVLQADRQLASDYVNLTREA